MTKRRDWALLAGLVIVSTVLRAWAALEVPVPWIAPDELVYGLLGRALWQHGSLDILGGPTPYYSLVTPVFAGFPLAVFGLDTGYDVLHVLQALAMSLTAVPVYLWARSLVSGRWSALAAAALAVAVPGLAYAGLVMTEVLFYPLLVLAVWAAAEALARRTLLLQALAVAALLAVAATRLQAIVLLPAYATAVALDAAMARSWAGLRKLWPAAAGFGALLVVWLAWQLGSGGATLGGYQVVADSSYSIGGAAKYVVYHLADLMILCGVLPALALVALLVEGLRRGERDAHVRAYVAVAASVSAWFVLEVGIFASQYSNRLVERYLIALAPVLFVGFVLWLERAAGRETRTRLAIAVPALVVLLVLPVKRLVAQYNAHDALTLIPLYRVVLWTSASTMRIAYMVAAVALVAVFALAPRRVLRVMPLVLVAGGILASVLASRYVVDQAQAVKDMFLGPNPSWVDDAGGKRVAYIYDGEPSWPAVWETVFWNRRIERIFDLGGPVPGPLPQEPAAVEADGTVKVPRTHKRKPRWALASTWMELAGEKVAEVAQPGLTQRGLALWHLRGPLRILTRTSGLQVNGDIYGPGAGKLVAYDCRRGAFHYTILVKEDQVIDIRVDQKLVRHLELKAGDTWTSTVPIARSRTGTCTFEIAPTKLVGTTQLSYERDS